MAYHRLYYHFVWTTRKRLPMIRLEIERNVLRLLVNEAQGLGARMYGINAMPDHIHLAATIPPHLSLSDFLKRIKGASSYILAGQSPEPFGWATGYGVFTFGPQGLPLVVNYVRNQKRHHADNTVIKALEFASDQRQMPPDTAFALDAFLDEG